LGFARQNIGVFLFFYSQVCYRKLKAPANPETLLRKHFFPKYFLGTQTGKHLWRKKCFLKKNTTNYLFLGFTEAKNVSATNVSCARQQGTF